MNCDVAVRFAHLSMIEYVSEAIGLHNSPHAMAV
jgi:hypothetical protein